MKHTAFIGKVEKTAAVWFVGFGIAFAVLAGSLWSPGAASARVMTVQDVLAAWQAGPLTFPRAADRAPKQMIRVLATAYSSTPDQTDSTPCITANGFDLCMYYEAYGEGTTIAANFLPMETQVRFPELFSERIHVVRDRMNARYGRGRIDIWFPTREEARQFGARWIEMEIF